MSGKEVPLDWLECAAYSQSGRPRVSEPWRMTVLLAKWVAQSEVKNMDHSSGLKP